MTRPSFQFYPGDWVKNPNLKRCTFAEKGIWLEVLCLMHDQEEYGVLRWPLKEVAEAVKCRPADLHALIRKGVLKGEDKALTEPFVYVPRSGRKDGPPVILVAPQDGPIWYSSRMVKDEYVRGVRGEGSKFGQEGGADPQEARAASTKPAPKSAPKPPFSDGPSSSSSSSPSGKEKSMLAHARARHSAEAPAATLPGIDPAPEIPTVPDCPHLQVLALWAEVLPEMPQHLPSQWKGARADHLRVRWRETAVEKGWTTTEQGLAYFRRLFAYIAQSKFLTGRARQSGPDKRPFVIELEWLVKPANWAKVIEGKFHVDTP